MADSSADGRPRLSGKLERGHVRYGLIRELAAGDRTQVQLAAKYDVTQSSISEFASRHRDRIEAVRANFDDKFAGVWVADKAKRIEEYAADLDRLQQAIDDPASVLDEDGKGPSIAELIKTKQKGLRQVAEELGHLPSRIAIHSDNVTLNYQVDGVDLEQLR